MIVDQDLVGGLKRLLVDEPLRGILQHVDGDSLRAMAHCRDAQVGSVSNQGRQENILGRSLFSRES